MAGPSTRNLAALPRPKVLKRLTLSIATLDAIICPEWEYRYYSFNSKWGDGEEVASMNNGQGDEWFIAFSKEGVFIKGFDHESTKVLTMNRRCPLGGMAITRYGVES